MNKVELILKTLDFLQDYVDNIKVEEYHKNNKHFRTWVEDRTIQVGISGSKVGFRVHCDPPKEWSLVKMTYTCGNFFSNDSKELWIDDCTPEEHTQIRDKFIDLWKSCNKIKDVVDKLRDDESDIEAFNYIADTVDNPIDNILLSDEEDDTK